MRDELRLVEEGREEGKQKWEEPTDPRSQVFAEGRAAPAPHLQVRNPTS